MFYFKKTAIAYVVSIPIGVFIGLISTFVAHQHGMSAILFGGFFGFFCGCIGGVVINWLAYKNPDGFFEKAIDFFKMN